MVSVQDLQPSTLTHLSLRCFPGESHAARSAATATDMGGELAERPGVARR